MPATASHVSSFIHSSEPKPQTPTRRCRRRKQSLDPASPLAVVFSMADSFQLLELRALCYRVRRLVMAKGLFIFDAFTRFNVSASTQLTCSELMSGVAWLGLTLTEQQVSVVGGALGARASGLGCGSRARSPTRALTLGAVQHSIIEIRAAAPSLPLPQAQGSSTH